jgi:hypothetical protein
MMGRLKSDQGQLFYSFILATGPGGSLGAEDRCCSRSVLASQRTCTSLFGDGSPVDRSGTVDPDAGRGECVCDPLGAADLPCSALALISSGNLCRRRERKHKEPPRSISQPWMLLLLSLVLAESAVSRRRDALLEGP